MRRRTVVTTVAITVWSLLLVPLAALAVLTDPDLSDALGISDQLRVTLTNTFRPAATDVAGIGDAVTTAVRRTYDATLGDVASVGDQVIATLSAAFRRTLADTSTIGDQVTAVLRTAVRPVLGDTVGMTDRVVAQIRAAARPAVRDTVAVREQLAIGRISAPLARIADLAAAVTGARLPAGTTKSLLSTLNAADAALTTDRGTAACGQLAAFVNEVQARSGKAIPTTTADALIATATQALRAIPCR